MKENFEVAFKALEQVLEDEIKVYRLLLDQIRREKDILISAKIDDLNENNRAKEAMLLKIRALDRIREKAARELGDAVGLKLENPKLLEIAAKVGAPHNTRLQSIHQTLELLIKRIKDFNQSNEVLVQSALKTINGALGAIRDTLQPKATYAHSGEIKREESQGHFVSKEV